MLAVAKEASETKRTKSYKSKDLKHRLANKTKKKYNNKLNNKWKIRFQNDKTAIYEFIFIDHIVFIFIAKHLCFLQYSNSPPNKSLET